MLLFLVFKWIFVSAFMGMEINQYRVPWQCNPSYLCKSNDFLGLLQGHFFTVSHSHHTCPGAAIT